MFIIFSFWFRYKEYTSSWFYWSHHSWWLWWFNHQVTLIDFKHIIHISILMWPCIPKMSISINISALINLSRTMDISSFSLAHLLYSNVPTFWNFIMTETEPEWFSSIYFLRIKYKFSVWVESFPGKWYPIIHHAFFTITISHFIHFDKITWL